MTQEEILQYSKRCAEFLGYEISKNEECFKLPNKNGWIALNIFHSDWNCIMQVKEAICKIDIIDEFNVHYDSVEKVYHCSILPAYKGYDCSILPAFKNTFEGFYKKGFQTEKEAVVEAINQFLIWYEQNK